MSNVERSEIPAPEELEVGAVLAERYRITGRLGTGGIGVVYRAVQLPLERPVAIKVLHDDLLTMDELRQRFEREARVLSALTHPHVVSISDYGIDGARPFLVMELLEGQTLEEVVRADPLEPDRAIHLIRQVLKGLASAHDKGISHRDLKPANVFLTELPDGTEHVKLLDFGLARMVSRDSEEEDVTLTQRGVVFGTPAYMSPEQAAGSSADVGSDVYSSGVLFFELLAGRRPFLGETRAELLRAHLTAPVPRLASVRPDLRLHEDLVDMIDVAMAKDPQDRFRNAGEMLTSLDAIVGPLAWLIDASEISEAPTQMSMKPVSMPPPDKGGSWRWGVVALLVAGLGFGAWALRPAESRDSGEGTPEVELGPPLASPPPSEGPRDPFSEPMPEPLEPFLDMVERGHVFEDRSEIAPLMQLARALPEDPRPLLLLGHLMVAKGWYTEGMRRYRRAHQRDPSVRGDPRMLETLVNLAARDSVGDDAAELLTTIYGAEALPALQTAIDEHSGQPMAQLRLVQLRDSLR